MPMYKWPHYEVTKFIASRRIRVEVYERRDRVGQGVCASVYVDGLEQLRFDLFDPPHMHRRADRDSPRRAYPSGLPLPQYASLVAYDIFEHYPNLKRGGLAKWLRAELERRSAS
jgi:hypothetical protein